MIVKIIHIIQLRIDAYQKTRIIQGRKIFYEGEYHGMPEELEDAQIKRWSVDNGTLVLEIRNHKRS